ncbi:MAG: hypothetical protein MZW92_08545 [Comamonadaceae bacterium]|nr:hypothetical protein [Comamonadaceae bacterium]
MPFGEFIPPGLPLVRRPDADADRRPAARRGRTSRRWQLAGQRIAVNICYEDLFGAEIIARLADPAQAPTLLLNLSNLGLVRRLARAAAAPADLAACARWRPGGRCCARPTPARRRSSMRAAAWSRSCR